VNKAKEKAKEVVNGNDKKKPKKKEGTLQ